MHQNEAKSIFNSHMSFLIVAGVNFWYYIFLIFAATLVENDIIEPATFLRIAINDVTFKV